MARPSNRRRKPAAAGWWAGRVVQRRLDKCRLGGGGIVAAWAGWRSRHAGSKSLVQRRTAAAAAARQCNLAGVSHPPVTRRTGQLVQVCSQRGADRHLRAISTKHRAVRRVPSLPCGVGRGGGGVAGGQVGHNRAGLLASREHDAPLLSTFVDSTHLPIFRVPFSTHLHPPAPPPTRTPSPSLQRLTCTSFCSSGHMDRGCWECSAAWSHAYSRMRRPCLAREEGRGIQLVKATQPSGCC